MQSVARTPKVWRCSPPTPRRELAPGVRRCPEGAYSPPRPGQEGVARRAADGGGHAASDCTRQRAGRSRELACTPGQSRARVEPEGRPREAGPGTTLGNAARSMRFAGALSHWFRADCSAGPWCGGALKHGQGSHTNPVRQPGGRREEDDPQDGAGRGRSTGSRRCVVDGDRRGRRRAQGPGL